MNTTKMFSLLFLFLLSASVYAQQESADLLCKFVNEVSELVLLESSEDLLFSKVDYPDSIGNKNDLLSKLDDIFNHPVADSYEMSLWYQDLLSTLMNLALISNHEGRKNYLLLAGQLVNQHPEDDERVLYQIILLIYDYYLKMQMWNFVDNKGISEHLKNEMEMLFQSNSNSSVNQLEEIYREFSSLFWAE